MKLANVVVARVDELALAIVDDGSEAAGVDQAVVRDRCRSAGALDEDATVLAVLQGVVGNADSRLGDDAVAVTVWRRTGDVSNGASENRNIGIARAAVVEVNNDCARGLSVNVGDGVAFDQHVRRWDLDVDRFVGKARNRVVSADYVSDVVDVAWGSGADVDAFAVCVCIVGTSTGVGDRVALDQDVRGPILDSDSLLANVADIAVEQVDAM